MQAVNIRGAAPRLYDELFKQWLAAGGVVR
jgi:hypothetical protein